MQRCAPKWRPLVKAVSLPYMLAISAAAMLGAGGAPGQLFSFHDTNVLGTSLDLQVNTATAADAEKAHAAVLAEIERLNKILSTYEPGTDIAKLNASTAPVKV